MKRGRPTFKLELTQSERDQLISLARSRSMPAAITLRARLILTCAEGHTNREVARILRVKEATVGKWRRRFIDRRLAGLRDEARPGPPRVINAEKVAKLLRTILTTPPRDGASRWTLRAAAAATGISKTSVQRYVMAAATPDSRQADSTHAPE
jgi:putative transposase